MCDLWELITIIIITSMWIWNMDATKERHKSASYFIGLVTAMYAMYKMCEPYFA